MTVMARLLQESKREKKEGRRIRQSQNPTNQAQDQFLTKTEKSNSKTNKKSH